MTSANQLSTSNKLERRVAIVGFGYVGCCIGAVLADRGCKVVGIDRRSDVVASVNAGKAPVNEPDLAPLIESAARRGLLSASTKFESVADADVILLTVGTPLGDDDFPDMTSIRRADGPHDDV